MSEERPTWQAPALSDRQAAIMRYLVRYINEHSWAPSRREIGLACGMASLSSVDYHLKRLAAAGAIVLGDGARMIKVI